jgi:hypothetical protein
MMPSNRKQMNVRLDDETEERIGRLLPVVSASVGLKLSQSDLVRLALIELERRHADALPPIPEAAKRRGKK